MLLWCLIFLQNNSIKINAHCKGNNLGCSKSTWQLDIMSKQIMPGLCKWGSTVFRPTSPRAKELPDIKENTGSRIVLHVKMQATSWHCGSKWYETGPASPTCTLHWICVQNPFTVSQLVTTKLDWERGYQKLSKSKVTMGRYGSHWMAFFAYLLCGLMATSINSMASKLTTKVYGTCKRKLCPMWE